MLAWAGGLSLGEINKLGQKTEMVSSDRCTRASLSTLDATVRVGLGFSVSVHLAGRQAGLRARLETEDILAWNPLLCLDGLTQTECSNIKI